MCRYPKPRRVISDSGREFKYFEFQELIESYGVRPKPIAVKNLQVNSIIKNVHLMMGNMIYAESFKLDYRDTWWDKVNTILQSITFNLRATVTTTVNCSSGQLVFN